MIRTPTGKTLLLAAKIALAAGLLAWVLSKVHWSDYVVDRSGESFDVVAQKAAPDGTPQLVVASGIGWWRQEQVRPASDFAAVPGTDRILRKGFVSCLEGIHVGLLTVALGGFLVSYLIVSLRWWMLLHIQDIRLSAWEAIRLTFLGLFFNIVIPGTVGGDLVKAYYVCKHTPKRAAVLVSIFVDRVLGLTELSLMAAVMLTVVWAAKLEAMTQLRPAGIVVAVVLAAVAATYLVVFSRRVRRALHIQKLYERTRFARYVWALGDAVGVYKRHVRALLAVVALTLGAHVLFVGSIGMTGVSLSLDSPYYSYFIYIPLIYIIGSVPLTPGGVGLIEKFYVVFFVSAHVSASQVLALALLARLIPIFWSLPGAVVAVTGPRLPKAAAMKAELGLEGPPPASEEPASTT